MAVTFTPNRDAAQADVQSVGSIKALVGTLTFSGSYSTGGDSLDLAALLKRSGLGKVFGITAFRGYTAEYVPATNKLKLYASANTEHSAAAYNAALTGSAVPVVIFGT